MTRADKPVHTHDSQCTVDPDTACCEVCGVEHGEPCRHCGGSGFHRDDCPMETMEACGEDVTA